MEFNATFIVSIISFCIFVGIMNKIFYAPMSKIIMEREELLKRNFKDAEELDNEANGILDDREEKLGKAEADSREIIAKRIDEFNNLAKQAILDANKKAKEEIQEQKNILAEEKIKAENVLKTKENELAQIISSKVLGFEVNIEEDYIAKEGLHE